LIRPSENARIIRQRLFQTASLHQGGKMGIKQEIEHTKTLLNQGVDLLLLRLQVINLDLAEQAENAFRTLLALLFSAVLLFIALFAALFGLNRLLDDATAVKVFFIAAAVCIVAVMLLLWRIWAAWRRHNGLFADSLNGLRDDIACLRGELSESEVGHE